MKILLAIGSGEGGGGARSISKDLLRSAAQRGHEIHVHWWGADDVARWIRDQGFGVSLCPRALPRTHELWKIRDLVHVIRRTSPDVVYTMFSFPLRAHLRFAAAAVGVPVATQVWTELQYSQRRWAGTLQRRFERMSARTSGVYIAPSRAVRAQLLELGIPDSSVELAPYGVPAEAVAASTADLPRTLRAFLERHDRVVIYVARLDRNKNQTAAVAAFSAGRIPGSGLVLLGKEDEEGYRRELEAAVDQFGIAEHVLMAGDLRREQVWSAMRQSSIFIQTSRHEGFGIAPLEAQAAGIPVVGYRSGGLTDVVADQTTGVLCAVDDVSELARALHGLLQDDDLRRRMGSAAQARARAEFDLDPCLDALFAILEAFPSPRHT